ncbi:MAG: phosphoglycerate kinase, partial [Betaproteobacteria bacterium]|nr:phosphoglycerate kinase [Betaproteobacteria bacterium]
PADPQLTRQAAETVAGLLPLGLPMRVSGLGRAQQMARELCRLRPDLPPPVIDARLNEMDFGRWELQPWDAIDRTAVDEWTADFAHHRFGGVESTQQVIERVADAIDELRRQAVSEALWVTHAGVIRAAHFLATHGRTTLADVGQWPVHAPVPGELQVLAC